MRVVIQEIDAVGREGVEVGRRDLLGAVEAHVVEPEVVGDEEEDVRG